MTVYFYTGPGAVNGFYRTLGAGTSLPVIWQKL